MPEMGDGEGDGSLEVQGVERNGREGVVDARSVRATARSTAMATRVVNPGQRGLTSRLSGRR